MPGFIRLDSGTVCGNLHSAAHEVNRFGKSVLKLEGQFDGTNDTILEVPAWIGDNLTQLGVMGEDQGGVWVDGQKRVAIWKNKDNGQTRWGVGDGNGQVTAASFGQSRQQRPQQSGPPQQQQRPMTPRPPGAQSVPQQQQSPTNGQPPQQRPQSAPQQPAEPAEVTRRRIKATMTFCLKEAAECWLNLGEAGKEVDPVAMQATAATIFLACKDRQLPLLPDPMAPPPITPEQIAGLKGFRDIWHRIGQVVNGQTIVGPALDQWFSNEIAKFGRPASLSTDQAKQAIDAMAIMIAKRESDIEKAKSATPNDPPPPVYTGASDTIPF